MTTHVLECIAKHPYPTFSWEFRLAGADEEGNANPWTILTDTNYSGYNPANQEADGGWNKNKIYLTNPLQGDDAWFQCNVLNPAGELVTTDGQCYVSIGPLEWTVDLKAETKVVEETAPATGPQWGTIPSASVQWEDPPRTIDNLNDHITSSTPPVNFDIASGEGALSEANNQKWTSPANELPPHSFSTRINATDAEGGPSISNEFTTNIIGVSPTVSISDPGTLTEGTPSSAIIATPTQTDGAPIDSYTWSTTGTAFTGQGTDRIIITSPTYADDNNATITCVVESYQAGSGYTGTGNHTLLVEAPAVAPTWSTIPDDTRSWDSSPRVIADLSVYVTGTPPYVFSDETSGSLIGAQWTADAHTVPGTTGTQITVTDDTTLSDVSASFDTTVTGVNPTATISDPGTITEGTGAAQLTCTPTSSDGNTTFYYAWSWTTTGSALSNTTGQTVSIDTPTAATDNDATLQCVVTAYAPGSGYTVTETSVPLVVEAGGEYIHDFTTDGIGDWDHDRASAATGADKDGIIQTAADPDGPVFPGSTFTDPDFLGDQGQGLQLETVATNRYKYSDDFQGANWTTVSSDRAAAGAGQVNNTATKLTPLAASQTHSIYQTSSVTNGNTYTYTLTVKPDGYYWLQLASSSGFPREFINIDLRDGSIGNSDGITATTSVSGGWVTIVSTLTSNESAGGIIHYSIQASDVGTRLPLWVGNGTDGIIYSHTQHETGNSASSFITTAASSDTRAAASASITTANMPEFPDGKTNDFSFQYVYTLTSNPAADSTILTISDITVVVTTTGVNLVNGGTTITIAGAKVAGDVLDIRGYLDASNNMNLYLGGWAGAAQSASAVTAITSADLGSAVNGLSGKFRLADSALDETTIEGWT